MVAWYRLNSSHFVLRCSVRNDSSVIVEILMRSKKWTSQIAVFVTCVLVLFGLQILSSHRQIDELYPFKFRPSVANAVEGSISTTRELEGDSNHTSLLNGRNIAVLLFCYNRPHYLHSTLASLATLHGLEQVSLIISQDGDDGPTARVIQQALAANFTKTSCKSSLNWQRQRIAEISPDQAGHAWLTQHYRWGIDTLFEHSDKYTHVVIIEDDMVFSPDFLLYFFKMAPLLDSDPTLWCISSWNDNAFTNNTDWNPKRVFRTTFFPGLGWMMSRSIV